MTATRPLYLVLMLVSLVVLPWSPAVFAQGDAGWEAVVDRVAKSVLAIQVDAPRDFDTQASSSAQATGFVIDAERGIVLTNRHVVQPGPVVAKGVFLNREEIELIPIYRDPVHDFGFYKYDPARLRYNHPEALPLYPEGAQLGREIRVIGNDGGEQLSVLAGTISRLDRPAPVYGAGKYNDFNTFYIQAASSTSGGSSGAPVVDLDGRVVALNAGANLNTASSFFLALPRVVRAFERVRQGLPVSRGTLQASFRLQPYDELKRLGLSDAAEQHVRQANPGAIGLLTVVSTVPQGPAHKRLFPGDILLKVDGEWVGDFITLEAKLDEAVGQPLRVEVERGGEAVAAELTVADLAAVTPAAYLSVGGGILHELSYQQARVFHVPVAGLYMAKAGYMWGNEGFKRGDVITAIAGQPVSTLAQAEAILKQIKDGERFFVRFFALSNPRQALQRVVTMDRRWFEAQTCQRDDVTGLWPCQNWPAVAQAAPPPPASTRFIQTGDAEIEQLAPSLVVVDFDMPYPVEGVNYAHYIGSGLIIDAERGWVLVDRNTVPSTLGDVHITFAQSLEVPGKVEFIHPFHSFAIVSYDPARIGATPVRSARFAAEPLRPGDDVWLVGAKSNQRLTSHKTTVADVDSLTLPLPRTPTFRETNVEAITLTSSINTVGGVLANGAGEVAAIWTSLQYQNGKSMAQTHMGIPARLAQQMLETVRQGEAARFRDMGAELQSISLAEARKRGLPEAWALKLERHNPARRSVFYTIRLVAGTAAAGLLREGDMILAIDGKVVNSYREVEQAIQKETIAVTLVRRGQVMEVELPTEALSGKGLTRVVTWAGAVLHRPQRALAAQRGFADKGLYVSWTWPGSPAAHYRLGRTLRLIELDGQPVSDIDSFLAALKTSAGHESVRLKVLDMIGKERVITLKPDGHYWPTVELVKNGEGWQRRPVIIQ